MGDMERVNGFTPDHIAMALTWARRYEARGWTCLPAKALSPDQKRKQPLLPTYAEYWNGGAPRVDELWARWPSGNVQVVCGRAAGLCVIDCDGPEGIAALGRLCKDRGTALPRTWVSSRHQGQGKHYWFRLPEAIRQGGPIDYRILWGVWEPEGGPSGTGGWRKRAAVELLCDRRLVMAPPSIHHTGAMYRWHRGNDPVTLTWPAELPVWLLQLDANRDIRPREEPVVPLVRPIPRVVDAGEGMLPLPPGTIRDYLPRLEIIQRWGVRVHSFNPNHRGWIRVHDFSREDRRASAMFNPTTGRYWRPEGFPPHAPAGRSICLFRLGVEMGHYATWRDCAFDLARSYLPDLFRKGQRNVS
jgi:hypothetical protein